MSVSLLLARETRADGGEGASMSWQLHVPRELKFTTSVQEKQSWGPRASVAGAGKGTKGRRGRVGKDTGESAWGWMARGRTLPLTS